MSFLNFFKFKKEKEEEKKEIVEEKVPKTWDKTATVTINGSIVYKYVYGDYSKFENGIQVMYTSGGLWYYEDFIKQVFNDYPPEKVTLLKLVSE